MSTLVRPAIALAIATVLALALLSAPQPAEAGLLGLDLDLGIEVADVIDEEIDLSDGDLRAILHPGDGVGLGALTDVLGVVGLDLANTFPNVGVISAVGPGVAFEALALTGLVERVEYDEPYAYFTETSHLATRGQDVLDGAVGGTAYDGSGVGVAVVDSGIDGTHPGLEANMGGNVKIVPFVGAGIPLPDTDTPSLGGHGTHVAGTVAGADADRHGAAPGASLYGVSAGTLISLHSGLEGLEWVLANHDQVTPAIRVVNNSWGSAAGAYDPGSAISIAVSNLVDEGVSVVWAAGNAGGDGSAQQTSPTCVDPTPGVLCVAAYDDLDSGTREGPIADFSSRGAAGAVTTYPDIAAPGANIVSTCRVTLPICATGTSSGDLDYWILSGTSMAAPHISGIVAQLYEANPDLTPAEVEDILEDTALELTAGASYEADPTNPTSETSFDKGHGLVDVVAAVEAALAR